MATHNSSTNSELVLSEINEKARGPTNYSHWVIPRRLLASAYPASKNPKEHHLMTKQFIIESSVQVIVNLMEEKELTGFTPYKELMLDYAKTVSRSLEFLSFPIQDRHINEDHQHVLNFCLELCDRLKKGQIVLIHCWGGHGRTGTIVSILIGMLFNMPGDLALSTNSRLHDERVRTNGIPSPETKAQFDQVRYVLDHLYPQHQKTQS